MERCRKQLERSEALELQTLRCSATCSKTCSLQIVIENKWGTADTAAADLEEQPGRALRWRRIQVPCSPTWDTWDSCSWGFQWDLQPTRSVAEGLEGPSLQEAQAGQYVQR